MKYITIIWACLWVCSCTEKKEELLIVQDHKDTMVYTPTTEKIIADTVQIKSIEKSEEQPKVVDAEKHEVLEVKDEIAPPNKNVNHIKVDRYLIGDLDFSADAKFEKVPDAYASKEIYLRKETLQAFLKMAKQAAEDGIELTIISGARNFNHQRRIWERKWNKSNIQDPVARAKNILKFSSMPMTSRHHWGTDIDINNLNNSYFESGKGLKEYQWLQKNAAAYGFCQVYTDKSKNNRQGYEMEKWHWSYMPLANQFLADYINQINHAQISGFQGSEVAQKIDVIQNYVKGVANCKD